jgi:hypothetical protein
MTNIISGFEEMRTMKEFSKSMDEFLAASEEANKTLQEAGSNELVESISRLRDTVSIIHETEEMLKKFYKGEISLEELEAFRDRISATRAKP